MCKGRSKKQISEFTGTSRNTVKKYIARFTELRLTFEEVSKLDDHALSNLVGPSEATVVPDKRYTHIQQYLPSVEKEMSRKGMTVKKLWERYIAEYPEGYSHAQFYHYHRYYLKGSRPVMHMEHKAGDKVFIDFAGDKSLIITWAGIPGFNA